MDNLPDAPPLTPFSFMLAGIHPDEFAPPMISGTASIYISYNALSELFSISSKYIL
jgi:hypothetical protein